MHSAALRDRRDAVDLQQLTVPAEPGAAGAGDGGCWFLLVQGVMLSLAGGALGLLTATWAAHVLGSSMATVFPVFLALDLTPDTTVLFATMMFCSLATVAFGLWPALRLSRPDLLSSLKDRYGEMSGKIAGRITVRDCSGSRRRASIPATSRNDRMPLGMACRSRASK